MQNHEDEEKKAKIAEKLKKIKALAERGVGGEKETAMKMYEELKTRYELEDEEILEDRVELHWFSYSTDWEEELLKRIFYMVTGEPSYHKYKGRYSRRKERGCDCTEVEAITIKMYFDFYKKVYEEQYEIFWIAFVQQQELFPDKTARVQQEDNSKGLYEMTEEERLKYKRAAMMGMGIDKKDQLS